MRRLVIFAAIWVLLFSGAVVFNLLTGEGHAAAGDVPLRNASGVSENKPNGVFDDVLRHTARTELLAKPRQTEGPPVTAAGFDEIEHQELASQFRAVLLDNKEQILGCLTGTLATLKRPTEYFELSFAFRRTDFTAAFGMEAFGMEGLALERTAVPFPGKERDCMFKALQKLRFAADSAPTERIFYEFCLNRPSQPAAAVSRPPSPGTIDPS